MSFVRLITVYLCGAQTPFKPPLNSILGLPDNQDVKELRTSNFHLLNVLGLSEADDIQTEPTLVFPSDKSRNTRIGSRGISGRPAPCSSRPRLSLQVFLTTKLRLIVLLSLFQLLETVDQGWLALIRLSGILIYQAARAGVDVDETWVCTRYM